MYWCGSRNMGERGCIPQADTCNPNEPAGSELLFSDSVHSTSGSMNFQVGPASTVH